MTDADDPAAASPAPTTPGPGATGREPGPDLGEDAEPDLDPEPIELPEPEPRRRLRAADPGDERRRDVAPAGQVLAVMAATLLLAAGLNSEAMLRSAEARPLGPGRDVAVGFWRPVYELSSRVGLTGPRDGLDALRRLGGGDGGDPGGDGAGTELVAGLPSAPAGPTADQGDGLSASGPLPAVEPDTADGGLLGLDPRGLGGVDRPARGPVAGDEPQGPPPAPAATASGGTAPPAPVTGTGSAAGTDPQSVSPPDGMLRRPTPTDPLRILLVGDSTMDAVGAAVLRELEPTGVTRAAVDYKVSSGLARPDFFDWPAHLRQVRAASDVELVVIMMGANDAQPFMIDGRAENFGTERWLAAYRERVASLLRELTADGGGVLWISQPVMRKERFDADMRQIDRIYAEEVAKVPRARHLDSRPLLADDEGAYATHLVDAAGDRQRVRQDDGIHITEAGAERLAPAVVDAINTMAPLY